MNYYCNVPDCPGLPWSPSGSRPHTCKMVQDGDFSLDGTLRHQRVVEHLAATPRQLRQDFLDEVIVRSEAESPGFAAAVDKAVQARVESRKKAT